MTLMHQPGDGQAALLINNGSATSAAYTWKGGEGTFMTKATWGGGTVKLQVLGPDGTTYIDVGSDTTLTADGGGNFSLPAGALIRANVATATAVYASVASLR
jgi:hypothetical protein